MKQAIADKWIRALRSGEFKQGHNALKTEDGAFCCLGVLAYCVMGFEPVSEGPNHPLGSLTCEMQDKAGMHTGDGTPDYTDSDSSQVVLPDFVVVEHEDGERFERQEFSSLAEANDSGASFAQIADWIESNWSRL